MMLVSVSLVLTLLLTSTVESAFELPPSEPVVEDVLVRVLLKPTAQWSEAERLFLFNQLTHPEAPVRAAVAAQLLRSEQSLSARVVWLLSHDTNLVLREHALSRVTSDCQKLTRPVCAAMLGFFVDDSDATVAWSSRDALLDLSPAQAVAGASADYKLDLLSLVRARIETGRSAGLSRVLGELAHDANFRVREEARMLLLQVQP